MKRPVIYLASAAMLLSPLAAHSADVAVNAPPPVPVFSWTGFYIGPNVGGAWTNNRFTDTLFLTNFSNNNKGVFIGGGQIGGNYQIGQFVIGGELDFDLPLAIRRCPVLREKPFSLHQSSNDITRSSSTADLHEHS